ncbi:MAG: branched-chain amino acid ABC transporter permease [Candidatus Tectomicrobia bacterium]|nr:branched-chain amino acid ABC transporter permease [Candidatus Tectomicrobia bacterium]
MFLQQLINGLTLGGVYALIAVGYTMVYGVIQLINFAHGEIYMFGAFLAYTFAGTLGVPFYLAMVLSMLCCAGLGMLIDLVAYRPLRLAPRLAALITAIGVSLFLQNLARILWGAQNKPFPHAAVPAYLHETALRFAGVTVSYLQLFMFAVTLAMMASLHFIITRTRYGKAMRACAQDRVAAYLMGIDMDRIVTATFALGSAMGAVAGVLVGVYFNVIFPTMGYTAGVKAFAAAVLGGIGNVPGAMLGGLVLGIGEAFGAAYLSSLYSHGIAYAIMILVIVLRPYGLLGKREGVKS